MKVFDGLTCVSAIAALYCELTDGSSDLLDLANAWALGVALAFGVKGLFDG